MRVVLRIRRFQPEQSPQPYWQEFEVDAEPATVVLYALHDIQENQDGSLAYRYSCRGSICGSCAMRINGAAALACKTRIAALDIDRPIVLEPLMNSSVIKDLVVDQGPFFAALRRMMPWLSDGGPDPREAIAFDGQMNAQQKDQFLRSADCIMCQSCFSDCPRRFEDEQFVGPAACLAAYKHAVHPQEPEAGGRIEAACGAGGVFDCDQHANCVKVCPKDCRPMRAIIMLRRRAAEEGLEPE